jgi:hypothetical protein
VLALLRKLRSEQAAWQAVVLALQGSTEACRELQREIGAYRAQTALQGR